MATNPNTTPQNPNQGYTAQLQRRLTSLLDTNNERAPSRVPQGSASAASAAATTAAASDVVVASAASAASAAPNATLEATGALGDGVVDSNLTRRVLEGHGRRGPGVLGDGGSDRLPGSWSSPAVAVSVVAAALVVAGAVALWRAWSCSGCGDEDASDSSSPSSSSSSSLRAPAAQPATEEARSLRSHAVQTLREDLERDRSSVVLVIGPEKSGKTTLVNELLLAAGLQEVPASAASDALGKTTLIPQVHRLGGSGDGVVLVDTPGLGGSRTTLVDEVEVLRSVSDVALDDARITGVILVYGGRLSRSDRACIVTALGSLFESIDRQRVVVVRTKHSGWAEAADCAEELRALGEMDWGGLEPVLPSSSQDPRFVLTDMHDDADTAERRALEEQMHGVVRLLQRWHAEDADASSSRHRFELRREGGLEHRVTVAV